MKKVFLIFFLTVLLGGLFLPFTSFAETKTYNAGNYTIEYEGLVPCGKCMNISPAIAADKITASQCKVGEGAIVNVIYLSCQFCHFFVMFRAVIDFVLQLVVVVAVLMIVVGGIMFLGATGDPGKISKARNLLTAVVVGLTIVFGAWLFVNVFFTFIGLSDFALQLTGPDKWFIVDCPIAL